MNNEIKDTIKVTESSENKGVLFQKQLVRNLEIFSYNIKPI